MGLTSIKSAMNALTNPDLSTFEKFTSILMSMSMGIPSLVSSFKIFGDTLAFTTSKTKEGLTAELAHVLGIDLETGAIIGNTGAKGANTVATGTNTTATEINTAAIWKSIAARLLEKAATVALVAVIGVALVGAIYLAVKAYNAESEAARQAAKVAEEAAKTASQVNNEYQNLINTLNELDSGVDKIHELERGTLEWRQAIMESNNALIELLSTYGMLSSENFTVDADGIMEITDKAKKDILEAQEKTVQMANSASYSA
jgi:type II secretory pathway pseudopilin PulG